ncbi:ABC transporter ATP-binding protein [Paraburkholderia sp. BR13439]|uniref:ABC transporter ATP-binding protein n=1 Tax=unclassified Paraburkholderia TaxID=2615204 RepID=UPI0034CF02C2
MTTVRFDQVSKLYGDTVAVQGLNFEVNDGEFLVMVGPSGCGKTTTLRMLAGLETPSYGRLWFDDKDMTLTPPGKRGIAMVFQSYALYPHLSVYRNLSFGLEIRHESKHDRDQRVRRVSDMLGLTKLLDRKPSALSGGQRQRIALGRAMITEPRLFLLDEPLSNLDAALRTQMRLEIAEMQRRLGVPTVYVTHDQVEAMTMGHRIAVFSHGKMLQIGTPEQLYRRPMNREVATFIGSPKMNILSADVVGSADAPAFNLCGSTYALDGAKAQAFNAPRGRKVHIGIRPQEIHWVQDSPGRCASRLKGQVLSVEPTGAETYVTVMCGTESLTARFPSFAPVAEGDIVELAFDTEDLHIFDIESGASLIDERALALESVPALMRA